MTTAAETFVDQPIAIPIEEPESRGFDWVGIVRSPAFWPGVALAAGLLLAYWPLMLSLWGLWSSGDGYYSHGFLVPLIMGYVVYKRWDRIKEIPAKPAYLAMVPILGLTWVAVRAGTAGINMIMAACLVGTLVLGTAFVGGWRWMWALLPASLYSVFALPFWSAAIDAYTNPLQQVSTKVAAEILKLSGYSLFTSPNDPTTIVLNSYTLNVAVPCSGLKLVLALTAFVMLFVVIARLPVWANAILIISILPMALFFNGLRIALIGMVGEGMGMEAASQFHDYSGFITLGICFFALFKFARALGWRE
jgi:exosortase